MGVKLRVFTNILDGYIQNSGEDKKFCAKDVMEELRAEIDSVKSTLRAEIDSVKLTLDRLINKGPSINDVTQISYMFGPSPP